MAVVMEGGLQQVAASSSTLAYNRLAHQLTRHLLPSQELEEARDRAKLCVLRFLAEVSCAEL